MTTITHFQSVPINTVAQLAKPVDSHSVSHHLVGRLIHIAIALSLLPAFLVVLAVSGVGIAVLKIDQVLRHLVEG